MDQIEKPLSILLIVAAIAYAFMYTDAGDGFNSIENNTTSGYTIVLKIIQQLDILLNPLNYQKVTM